MVWEALQSVAACQTYLWCTIPQHDHMLHVLIPTMMTIVIFDSWRGLELRLTPCSKQTFSNTDSRACAPWSKSKQLTKPLKSPCLWTEFSTSPHYSSNSFLFPLVWKREHNRHNLPIPSDACIFDNLYAIWILLWLQLNGACCLSESNLSEVLSTLSSQSTSQPHLNYIATFAFHSSEFATWSNHALWVEFSPHLSCTNEYPRNKTKHTHTQRISRILDFNLPILKRNVFHLSLDCTKELIRSPYLASCQGSSRPRRTCNNRPVGSGRSFPI